MFVHVNIYSVVCGDSMPYLVGTLLLKRDLRDTAAHDYPLTEI